MDDLVTWPSALPLPQQDGYGYQPPDLISRTDNDAGTQRVRQRFTSGVTLFNFTLRLPSQAQVAIWDAFVRYDLKNGQKWFLLDLETGIGITPHACRLRTSQPKRSKIGPGAYDVSITVEADEYAVLSMEEYMAIRDLSPSDARNFGSSANRLHAHVHATMPSRDEWGYELVRIDIGGGVLVDESGGNLFWN